MIPTKAILDYLDTINWGDARIREDLRIAEEAAEGEWPDVRVYCPRTINDGLSFQIGETHIWRACFGPSGQWVGYQIADLIDGRYQNHRGCSASLRDTLRLVLNERYRQQKWVIECEDTRA